MSRALDVWRVGEEFSWGATEDRDIRRVNFCLLLILITLQQTFQFKKGKLDVCRLVSLQRMLCHCSASSAPFPFFGAFYAFIDRTVRERQETGQRQGGMTCSKGLEPGPTAARTIASSLTTPDSSFNTCLFEVIICDNISIVSII